MIQSTDWFLGKPVLCMQEGFVMKHQVRVSESGVRKVQLQLTLLRKGWYGDNIFHIIQDIFHLVHIHNAKLVYILVTTANAADSIRVLYEILFIPIKFELVW